TYRASTSDVNNGTRPNAGGDGTVVTCREDVRQAGQIANLLHRLSFVWELEQVEIGVGNHYIFRLSSHPSPHVDVSVGRSRSRRIHTETGPCGTLLTIAAATAGNVKGD